MTDAAGGRGSTFFVELPREQAATPGDTGAAARAA